MEAIKTKFLNKENERVIVYEGEFEIKHSENSVSYKGTIYYSSSPYPNIYFEGVSNKASLIHAFANELELRTSETNFGKVHVNMNNLTNGEAEVHGEMLLTSNTNFEEESIDRCLLHVTNFMNFRGDMVQDEGRRYTGGLLFNYQEWEIQIQKRHDYDQGNYDVYRNLNAFNNFDITHVIQITKSDGTDFKRADIENLIDVWQWTLDFSMGKHVGIPVELGKKQNNTVYEKFQKSLTSEFQNTLNWSPSDQRSNLDKLFKSFIDISGNNLIFNELKKIIHTYIEANLSLFVEFKTILAQIALEKLSWLLLHEVHSPSYSKTKYDNLGSFGDKLRTTLSTEVNSSTQLPDKLSHITDKHGNVKTGPNAINDLRNDIAHPARTQNTATMDKWHITQLALLYVEKCTLHLVNYQGDFNYRIS